MDIVIVGIDLGKNSCSLAGLDASGRVVLRRRMRRSAVGSFVTSLRRCVVAVEACCGAHPLGRLFCRSGTRGPPDVAGIYAPLCEGPEERRSGRRGDRGGGEPADDAVC